jgi:hypothetical protein
MRKYGILLIAAAAGSCSMAPGPSPAQFAQSQAKFAELTAGKMAGAPMNCLPSYQTNDMIIIDDGTLAFRNGRSRVYINHMQGGGCPNIDGGMNTLVTRSPSGTLCRGDIASVVDLRSHMPAGTCIFGDFVPYTRVG